MLKTRNSGPFGSFGKGMRWRSLMVSTVPICAAATFGQSSGDEVTFRVVVKLPPSYSYDAAPGVEYRTVLRLDAGGLAKPSGEEHPLVGEWYAFTERGDTAVKETWSADRRFKCCGQSDSTSVLVQRKVYWQPVPGNEDRFLFVSRTGFVTIDDGKLLSLGTAPDNLIEDIRDEITGRWTYMIWRNGRREPFRIKGFRDP